MQSFKKKIVSLIDNGVEPLQEGINNFKYPDMDIELLAEERKNVCVGCEFYEREPIDFLRVEENRIPELSEMMCGECGCTLSYKLRQSKSKCNKWLE